MILQFAICSYRATFLPQFFVYHLNKLLRDVVEMNTFISLGGRVQTERQTNSLRQT